VIPHIGSGGTTCFQSLPRLPSWKVSNNPQTTITTLENWHDVVRIVERGEQAIMMEKIKGSVKDSRTMMRDESGDDSKVGNLSYVV